MKKLIKKHPAARFIIPIGSMLLFGAAGYLYYLFVGCSSGGCSITSSPINSTIYGAIIGMLLGFLFNPTPDKD